MGRPLSRASDLSQSRRLIRSAALADALVTLRDPGVRDLAWLLLAPRLLSEHAFGSLLVPAPDDVASVLTALQVLDADPAPLRLELAPLTTRRVGHYAERLVHYALGHLSPYTLIASNLPLRVGKQTIGEFDFLLEDRAGARLHWELAVKCYLRVDVPGIDDPLASFVGPALGDRLDIKLARLLEHQLPLSGRTAYASLLPAGPWQAQMWVSGWLFDRFDHWRAKRAIDTDPRLADDIWTGFWTSAGEWPAVAAAIGADGWTRLPRLRWIAPLGEPDHSFCNPSLMTERIAQTFFATTVDESGDEALRPRDDPFAIAAWKQGADGRWSECARGFIVADDWEQRARIFAAS